MNRIPAVSAAHFAPLLLVLALLLAALSGSAHAESPPGVLHSQFCRIVWNYGNATYGEYQMEADLAATGDAEAGARAEELAEDLESAGRTYDDKGCTIYREWPWKVD